MSLIFLLIFLLPFALAGILILRGVRGCRVGDHPVCRRCGFDLYGQPLGTAVCGECGKSITKPGSVVIGHRRRRPMFIVVGLVIALPILFVFGAGIYTQTRSINWLAWLPLASIRHRAESTDPTIRSPAIKELNARIGRGVLSQPELDSVVDAGLAYQADFTKQWDTAWGELIEDANDGGHVNRTRWQRYVKQAISEPPEISIGDQFHSGEKIGWWFGIPTRLAARSNVSIYTNYVFRFPDYQPNSENWRLPGVGDWASVLMTRATGRSMQIMAAEGNPARATLPLDMLPGTHEIRITVTRTASDWQSTDQPAQASTELSAACKFKVLPGPSTAPGSE